MPTVDEEDIVWGVAYRIDQAKEEEVRAYLGEYFGSITRYDDSREAGIADRSEHREKVRDPYLYLSMQIHQ